MVKYRWTKLPNHKLFLRIPSREVTAQAEVDRRLMNQVLELEGLLKAVGDEEGATPRLMTRGAT